ncbi:hypothetical protein [Streptosporangium sp. NPDC048865]|uniref:hypothetical protein n=1 Tax=Streptosporangium sp. NPDC048865 TaxID=3155766 RepID=UPI0034370DFB
MDDGVRHDLAHAGFTADGTGRVRVTHRDAPDFHLTAAGLRAFTLELAEALSGAAEPGVGVTAQEVIAGRRATVRIKAGPARYAQARKAAHGGFGPVEVSA